jgi:flagellum-specific ATP synthase
VLDSLSRLMPAVAGAQQMQAARKLRELMSAYASAEDLVRVGAYQKGSDPLLDRALELLPQINAYLRQTPAETSNLEDAVRRLTSLPV